MVGSTGDMMFPSQLENARMYKTEALMVDSLCHDMMLARDWEKGAEAVPKAIKSMNFKNEDNE